MQLYSRMTATLVTAAWLAPMSTRPMRDGGVVLGDGRITAIGSTRDLRRDYPAAVVHDAGNAVILPGLVNAHTHLELSLLTPGDPPARFVDWIVGLMQRGNPSQAAAATLAGVEQCLRFGITTIGDITSQPAITRPLLQASPLAGISYGEVRGMAQRRSLLDARISAAAEPINSVRLSAGISPHAPYSIETTGYEKCLQTARKLKLPLATHLAETLEEAEFVGDQTGPFKWLWDQLNAWDANVPRFTGGPIRFAKSIGLLEYPSLLAHVNYCDDDELDLLAAGHASVVYCPRTHAFFGHPRHRFREMLARGINVAIGTDSTASSPDLNLVDDLRLLHEIAPEISAFDVWRLATTNAARALILAAGSLIPGSSADMAIFPTASDDPLLELLETRVLPSEVWIGGVPIGEMKNKG